MAEVVVTEHSVKRTKDRLGLSKKLADKNAQKALEFGITHSYEKSIILKFIYKLYLSNCNANNMRVYHHHVYLFRGNKLITIIDLPQNLCKLADQIQKQKDGGRDENG